MSKSYSLAAHLIHSGLQMVWKRINITVRMSGEDILSENKKLIDRVVASLFVKFDIKINKADVLQAVEMLRISLTENPVIYYEVYMSDSFGLDRPVGSNDGGVTIIDAHPSTRLTSDQANDLMRDIWKHHGKKMMHIKQRIGRDLS